MNTYVYIFFLFFLFLFLPVITVGISRKFRALFMGRKGPSVFLFFFDLKRMYSKSKVESNSSGEFAKIAPNLALYSSLIVWSIVLFEWSPYIFIPFFLALYRIAMIGFAMETGTSFGGMASAREVLLSVMSEPTMILMILVAQSHIEISETPQGLLIGILFLSLSFVVVLADLSKPPFDDPRTHLELTMVHEAMLLEASGKSFFSFELAAGIKQASLFVFLIKLALEHSKLLKRSLLTEESRDILILPAVILLSILLGYIESISVRRKWSWIPEFMGLLFISILVLGTLVKLT